jgi:hypothetical protein
MYRKWLNRRTLMLVVLGGIAGTALSWAVYVGYANLRDRRVARETEVEVIQALQALPPDHTITRRYGTFVRLDGEGYKRSTRGIGSVFLMRDGPPPAPIYLWRTAVFKNALVELVIAVRPGASLELEKFLLTPDDSAVAAGTQLTIENGEIWYTEDVAPDLHRMLGLKRKARSVLRAFASHPKCPS